MRTAALLLLLLPISTISALADSSQPLPNAATLIQQVEAHQRELDKTLEKYTYLQRTVINEVNKNGGVKKSQSEEADIVYVNGHPIEHVIRKNGKELSASDQKKEQDKSIKEVERAQSTPPEQSLSGDMISLSRLLDIMKLSAPRHAVLDNRPMLLCDFTGDPHAKTHGRAEGAIKKISGMVWIDEQDRQVRRMIAHFDDNFNIGYGVVTLAKDSSFTFDQKLINNELWLPTSVHVHILGKALGFLGYRGEVQVDEGNYQQFHTDAQQQH